jgi:hypothetical protein
LRGFAVANDGQRVIGTELIVWSAKRGPIPMSARRSMIGANIARSIVSCWILNSTASRFLGSRSRACCRNRSSMSMTLWPSYEDMKLKGQ